MTSRATPLETNRRSSTRHGPTGPSDLEELVRLASLAPSSHNSQPWRFRLAPGTVELLKDPGRTLDVADADRRELYISLGCALENLLVAAAHRGLDAAVEPFPDPDEPDLVARVRLGEGNGGTSAEPRGELFRAIPERTTNHRTFDDRPVDRDVLERLESMAPLGAAALTLRTDADTRDALARLMARADRKAFADRDYRSELGEWLGRGVLGPTGLTARLAGAFVHYVDIGTHQGRRDARLVRSAPVLGLVHTAEDGAWERVVAGRLVERIWLAATAEGLAVHPLSQPLEDSELRGRMAALFGVHPRYAQHAFRLGHARPEATRRPRRPLEDILEEAD